MNKGIITKNLAVGYNKKVVIGDVELQIQPGKIVTLIGPNGCGKSTILKTILGQLSPLGGTVFIGENDLKKIGKDEKSKLISMVMTKRPKTELMTCFEVVCTGRYPYTGRFGILSDKDKKIVSDSMKYIGAEGLSEVDFSCLSDGQKQRIMIARAIAQEPEILVLDEPTSFLDVRYKLDILCCIKKLVKEKNIAVIMSLHELELAKSISDTIVAIGDEKIGKIGSPEDIFKDGYIPELYNISKEYFDEERGTLILPEWE